MDKMIKVFTSELRGIDEKEQTITAFISVGTRDRMDEVLVPEGMDRSNFYKNPIVLWAHKYDEPPIGRALWIKREGDGIISKMKFAPTEFAQEIFSLYKDGFLKAFSVGFMPKEYEDGDGEKTARRTYKKWELLEYSAVPVPAHPDALTLAIQKGTLKTETLIKSIEDNIECETGKCKTIVTKPEETDDYIRIPIRECEITATITISDDEGIKALYCGKVKKIATYLFEKAKGWTMEKAKKWVDEHKDEEKFIPKNSANAGFDELSAENKLLKNNLANLEQEIKDMRFKMYEILSTKTVTPPEMAKDEILKKIEDIFFGVIRKAQGKVS